MCVAHTNELDVKSAQHSWVQTSLQKQSSSLQIGVNWVVNWSRGGGGGNSWEIKGDHYKVVQQSGRGEPWTYLCMYRWENLEGPQRKNFLGFSALAGEGIPLQRKENSSAEDLQLSSSDDRALIFIPRREQVNILPEKCLLSTFSTYFTCTCHSNAQRSGVQATAFSPMINFVWGWHNLHWTQSLSFCEICHLTWST